MDPNPGARKVLSQKKLNTLSRTAINTLLSTRGRTKSLPTVGLTRKPFWQCLGKSQGCTTACAHEPLLGANGIRVGRRFRTYTRAHAPSKSDSVGTLERFVCKSKLDTAKGLV